MAGGEVGAASGADGVGALVGGGLQAGLEAADFAGAEGGDDAGEGGADSLEGAEPGLAVDVGERRAMPVTMLSTAGGRGGSC
ncbi:hypothetical protein ACFQXA_06320 [Nocardiopsis composta]